MGARLVLLVGTRKGLFILDGDESRQDWRIRGPYCDGWGVFNAVFDTETQTIYASASSEWHGAGVWRSADLGETWTLSSEGLGYGDGGDLKLSRLSGLSAAQGRVRVGAEAAGVFESRDAGATWSLISTLDDQPGRDDWNVPGNQPPGHLGMSAIMAHPSGPEHYWVIVQGFGAFETEDGGGTWTPRNRGLRSPIPGNEGEVGYCVHKLVRSPVDADRMYQQNHCGMYRSDDGGRAWIEITDGLPCDFGFAAAAHPHDRDSFYVIPLDPGHNRCMPEGRAAVWRTSDGGATWRRLDQGLPSRDAHIGVLREGMAIDSLDTPGLYFATSTGQVFASADEGEQWEQIAGYLPAASSVHVATVG